MTPKQRVLEQRPAAYSVVVFWNSWWQWIIRNGASGADISGSYTTAQAAWKDAVRNLPRKRKKK